VAAAGSTRSSSTPPPGLTKNSGNTFANFHRIHERNYGYSQPAMRLSEVARRLAISRASAYRLVLSGQLSGVRVGTTWRVLRVDFEAYLERIRGEAELRYRNVRG
jgi:excisionase family DNA binding protein